MEKNNNDDINDNAEILNLLKSRLELGKKTYGHGVRVNDKDIDWELMALEDLEYIYLNTGLLDPLIQIL